MKRETLSAISQVKNPLGLFVLALLMIDAMIGIIVMNGNEIIRFYIGIGMLAALFLIISGFIILLFLRPRSLYGQPTESKEEIVAVYLPYSESLLKKAERQVGLNKTVQSSLIQLFPDGIPHGVEPKEWQIISSLLSDQSSIAANMLEIAKQLNKEINKKR
jgi:hypothetical protein